MRIPLRLGAPVLLFLGGWGEGGLELPYAGPVPDEPAGVSHLAPGSILSGTRSFRPVEPLPWGDINRRVAPNGGSAPADRSVMPEMPGHGGH